MLVYTTTRIRLCLSKAILKHRELVLVEIKSEDTAITSNFYHLYLDITNGNVTGILNEIIFSPNPSDRFWCFLRFVNQYCLCVIAFSKD